MRKQPELILALDVSSREEALAVAAQFTGLPLWMKVGLELYTVCGPGVVQDLVALGFPVFLDLKFHDIPNTVEQAVRCAVQTGASMLTLHACGGKAMLEAARRGRDAACEGRVDKPLLMAVTVLTSMSPADCGCSDAASLQALVTERASLARHCGLDGVVSSALEVPSIKNACGKDFLCLCPGIRFAGKQDMGDQVRVVAPDTAVEQGADFLVMGRPIRTAPNPVAAAGEALTLMAKSFD